MNPKKIQRTLVLLSLLAATSLTARATVLTFGELPNQSVNGLTYQGVTFHFTIGGVSSTDAFYHASNGGTEQYVQDPSLEGNATGILTLDFATPTSGLQFGLARSVNGPLTPGLQVSLYDAGLNPLGTSSLNTQVYYSFSETQFSSGLTIGRAVLSFPSAGAAPRFAMDNLTFTLVPEPSALWLGGLAILLFRRRITGVRFSRA